MADGASGFNFDLGGFFTDLIGHPQEAQAAAQGQVQVAQVIADAQSDVAIEQIQAQQAVEEKKIETVKILGVSSIFLGLLYLLFKSLW